MVMAQGQLLMTGTADAVLNDPRVVEAYLGSPA
jgi:ABC-type branched-subunit amino acid transport system ATPase component